MLCNGLALLKSRVRAARARLEDIFHRVIGRQRLAFLRNLATFEALPTPVIRLSSCAEVVL